jgi:hypothetical protein
MKKLTKKILLEHATKIKKEREASLQALEK